MQGQPLIVGHAKRILVEVDPRMFQALHQANGDTDGQGGKGNADGDPGHAIFHGKAGFPGGFGG